jgi:hypothetical protein
MTDRNNHVRAIRTQSKASVQGALSAGWARVSAGRKGAFADNLEICTSTVNRALIGETVPELHTAFNSLADDPTALDEVFALYGLAVHSRQSVTGSDMELAAQLGGALASYLTRLADGKICHRDTLAMAELFRPIIPRMVCVVDQADTLRGVGK